MNAITEPFTPSRPVAIADIHLCSGIYMPTCADLPPVEVLCQTVVINGASYVWIDGVDVTNPVLLPVQALHGFRKLGTQSQYFSDEKHATLGEDFDRLIELCVAQQASATLMVRACEIMHVEGLTAEESLVTARQWGLLLCELDQAERAAYLLVAEFVANPLH